MRQRLRELGCVLFGHDWFFYGMGVRPKPGDYLIPLTHKGCRRCQRTELNL